MMKKQLDESNCNISAPTAKTIADKEEIIYQTVIKMSIFGWKKKCLYLLIFGLLVMVFINLALTLWVLKVMEFSSEGMGPLKIISGGIKVEGKAFLMDTLVASSIRSKTGQPIRIESSGNLTLSSRDPHGYLQNLIYLGGNRFECLTNSFKILDDRGSVLFSANQQEVFIGADLLKVTGQGGATFSGNIQTPLIRAESGHGLRLESATRSVSLKTSGRVSMESRAGEIRLDSFKDVTIQSAVGAVKLDSSSVLMPTLPAVVSSSSSHHVLSKHYNNNNNHAEAFQLCACKNGKLFLSPSHSACVVNEHDRVCR